MTVRKIACRIASNQANKTVLELFKEGNHRFLTILKTLNLLRLMERYMCIDLLYVILMIIFIVNLCYTKRNNKTFSVQG